MYEYIPSGFDYDQCPDEIVPEKSTSTTLPNTPVTYKHDSVGSFSITGYQLNRVYVRAGDYAKLYWSTCPVLFRPDTDYDIYNMISSQEITNLQYYVKLLTAKLRQLNVTFPNYLR
jgi:hypothetical protein